MKILIIGAVAAGTSVAAKARRNDETAEIVVYDRDQDISYAVCGIPYAVGQEVKEFSELTPRDAAWFKKRYNVDIHTSHEVNRIDHQEKKVFGVNLLTNEEFTDTYDVLVFATGSVFNTPPVFKQTHYNNVFQVKNIQSGKVISEFIEQQNPNNVLVIGAGYIGLEMAEQLKRLGLDVSVLQRSSMPMSHMDADMSIRIIDEMNKQGVHFYPEETVSEIIGSDRAKAVITTKNRHLEADFIILATGVAPNTKLAQEIGVLLHESGAILTDNRMMTNLDGVYAVGDCATSFNIITGQPTYVPLATTANKMGRIAGDALTGGELRHRGILGTGILRFFDLTIGHTGLNEREARHLGYDVEVLFNIKPDRPEYMKGKEMVIKAIADRGSEGLLGVQIIGPQGVDKRLDVFVTAITLKAKVSDLFHLDLAYAPPFSTTKDPVMYTGMALTNAMKDAPLITPEKLIQLQEEGRDMQIIDARSAKDFAKLHVPGAINIPLANIRQSALELDKGKMTVVYCNKGVTGNATQNVLKNLGFKEVYNISGGNKNYQLIYKQIHKVKE